MATPTEALYKALSDPQPNPQVVHSAIEEIRQLAGQNVIEILGAKTDALGSRIDALGSRIDALGSHIDALNSKFEMLQRVIWRVIWPLIGLLATTVFGLLYQLISS